MRQLIIRLLGFWVTGNLWASSTQLIYYRPFVEQFLEPATQIEGVCFGQSKRSTREDAYRCQSEDRVLDPCFNNLFSKSQRLICPEAPWLSIRIDLLVNQALDNTGFQMLDMSTKYPWGVELNTGEHCLRGDHGEYLCDNGGILTGSISRCAMPWKVLFKKEGKTTARELIKAWF